MSKRFQMAAIAVALAAASSGAFAEESGAFFINGNLGQSSYNSNNSALSNNNPFTATVRGGYGWYGGPWDFGVEAGYVDLGKATGSVSLDGIRTNVGAHAQGPLLGINLKYEFENKWFVSGRVGYLHTTMTESVSGFGSESAHGGGGYGGVGVGYDFTKHFSVGAGYDNYRIKVRVDGVNASGNVGTFTGFAEYRF
jgi:Outer membrane protein beta-barrel domain